MVAIETQGRIDREGKLLLDEPLQLRDQPVRVLILVPELDESDAEWLQAVSRSPSFDFLREEEEVYSREDGKPLSQ